MKQVLYASCLNKQHIVFQYSRKYIFSIILYAKEYYGEITNQYDETTHFFTLNILERNALQLSHEMFNAKISINIYIEVFVYAKQILKMLTRSVFMLWNSTYLSHALNQSSLVVQNVFYAAQATICTTDKITNHADWWSSIGQYALRYALERDAWLSKVSHAGTESNISFFLSSILVLVLTKCAYTFLIQIKFFCDFSQWLWN